MHFTLWPSRTANEGGHAEINWDSFLAFVSSPAVAADKNTLEGWSPARFAENHRSRAAAELVSAIVLDDDKSGLALERVCELWGGFAGVMHSSHSHAPAAPKWRIVLRVSRDMTPDEHARVWRVVRDHAAANGQTLDEATKDPSRLWFVPAHAPGARYELAELDGVPLDVDAILAEVRESGAEREEHAPRHGLATAGNGPSPAVPDSRTSAPAVDRRRVMALTLGSAWPATGRHEAQLALAGALRAEGWPAAEALDFLCAVARTAGDEDRPKREATIRHTYARSPDAPTTGWARLKGRVDPLVVDAVRGALGRDAEWSERTLSRLVALAAPAPSAPTPAGERLGRGPTLGPERGPRLPTFTTIDAGPFRFEVGAYDGELPAIDYQVENLIARGEVVMFVAHGNSLKTWLAFSIAGAVASGRPWLGRFVTQRGRAAILDFESGKGEVLRRFKLLGVRAGDVGDRLLRVSYPAAQLTDPETWLSLAELRCELIVVDSFNAASPEIDENDARSALMLQHAARVAEHTGATVLFIHHARKGTGGDRRESVRGSTALFAACDRIFEFADLERKEGGIVLSTMRSVKDGAGRAPADVRVELSDQGVRFVEEAVKELETPEEDSQEKCEREIVEILRKHPSGANRETLIGAMTGRKEKRRGMLKSVLDRMILNGLVIAQTFGKDRTVRLSSHVTL